MRKRLLFILLIAGAMGLLSSVLVYRFLSQVAANATNDSEPIVVATVNIGLGETVTTSHVKLVRWPKTSVPAGALRTLDQAYGRFVRSSVVAGEPLIETKLAPHLSGKGGIMSLLIEEGHRGVTIKVDDATRESGFVLPNSRVDVLVSMNKVKGSDERIAKVILQDVPVLAAGQAVEMRDNRPVTVSTVTLSLTPEQTERMAVAQHEGRITLAMRNLRDKVVVTTRGATPTGLLTDAAMAAPAVAVAAVSKPRPARAVSRAPAPPPAPETVSVTVIRGGQVSEKVFVRNGSQWVERVETKK